MQISILKEQAPEKRVALVPKTVAGLTKKGLVVFIERDAGLSSGYMDGEYEQAGAKIEKDREKLIQNADLLFRIQKTGAEEVILMKKGCYHISLFDPFHNESLLNLFAKQQVNLISLEMIPRITTAQKFDVLTSQASIAGYAAVILAAEKLHKAFPLMMTAAGTISPAKIFIIGAGVAGLQAIATAKRLGARVEAFDTRPDVEEQVKSLGASFLKIDLGETGQTKGGYAQALTEEQLSKQRQELTKVFKETDVIITTAQVFGKKSPLIITKEMMRGMKPGSVIIDMAVESGGNVEGSVLNQEVNYNQVLILGYAPLAGKVGFHASQMFSNNMEHLWLHYQKDQLFTPDPADPIMEKCLLVYKGKVLFKGV